jgi:uncharacterized SAM-binding protein YcdF (DUF218 family)
LPPIETRILRWAIPGVALVVILLAYPFWLRALGSYLVNAQEPFKADIIVVLGGDDHGNRVLKAAELVKQGYAPRVLISGPYCCFGHNESELAVPFAVRHGYPADWFIPFPIPVKAGSTVEEARVIVDELDRRHVGRFLIVTSNYHTRRAGRVYRKIVPPDRFRMVAAPDWAFHPENWWRSRDGRKQSFFEWSKTVANWVGL